MSNNVFKGAAAPIGLLMVFMSFSFHVNTAYAQAACPPGTIPYGGGKGSALAVQTIASGNQRLILASPHLCGLTAGWLLQPMRRIPFSAWLSTGRT